MATYRSLHPLRRRSLLTGLLCVLAAPLVFAQDTAPEEPVIAEPLPLGSWQSLPDMPEGRYAATVTPLSSNKVLIAGGYKEAGTLRTTLNTALLFTPGIGFTSTGSLATSRNFATATALNSGKVLIAGGYNSSYGSLASVELYDPATGKFTKLRSSMTTARELFTATKLPNGKVLLVGGFKTGFRGGTLRSAELFDPGTGKFTATGAMVTPYGRFGHDAILLPGLNKVLIVGGKERRSNTDWRSLKTAELYDIATGKFTLTKTSMAFARDRVTGVWIDAAQRVLVVGGKTEGLGVSDDVLESEWYDPATQAFTLGPSLTEGRMAHTLTKFLAPSPECVMQENVLVTGGWSVRANSTIRSAERLVVDPANPLGGQFVSAGTLAHSGHDHCAAYIGGQVLVVGGKKYEWTPAINGWTLEWLKRAELYTP